MHGITVHIDPEDDETCSPSKDLPSRNKIMAELYPLLQQNDLDKDINNIVLHYIDGKVEVEIIVAKPQSDKSLAALNDACKQCKYVRSISVNQKLM